MELQIIWFALVALLLAVYAMLDGFDIGCGILLPFAKSPENRQRMLGAIGPFWDGNEVWLLTGGGAIFAAFPNVYATVFSGFYLALMLLLAAMIFRAISVEFRSKLISSSWRAFWDGAFFVSSLLMALLFGVAIGNIIRGIPINSSMEFAGTFVGLLNPYSIMIGVLAVAMFATHGATYLVTRSTGELNYFAVAWVNKAWAVYLTIFIVVFSVTLFAEPHLFHNFKTWKYLWLSPMLVVLSILFIQKFNINGRPKTAFISSSVSIVAMMAMMALALFPNMVPALNDSALSLTITNASSSQLTLKTMLIIACIGMPFVAGYTIWIYRVFKGKTAQVEQY